MRRTLVFFRKIFFIVGIVLFVSTFELQSAFAAGGSATITTNPSTGSYSAPFTVDVVLDGGGQVFNAAQATVTVSSGLNISDLVLGMCKFSFLSTPSSASPSFSGVILGGSSKKCTVYTLTLVPVTKGNGSVSFSKATVKRFGDAVDIFSKSQDGTYTLTAAVKTTQSPLIAQPKDNLYTVVLKILNTDNTPVTSTEIKLNGVADKSSSHLKTDATGTVQFTDLKSGVYTATVANHEGDNVLNVAGNNHVLVMGIKLKTPQNISSNIFTPLVLVGTLLIGIILGTVIFKIIEARKRSTSH